jgi:hypothetical protein
MQSVYELAVAEPHAPEDAKFTRADWRAYRRGYVFGLVMALRVMQLARERWQLRLEDRRRRRAEARASVARAVQVDRRELVEQTGVALELTSEKVVDRLDQVNGDREFVTPLRVGVEHRDVEIYELVVEPRGTGQRVGAERPTHVEHYAVQFDPVQLEKVKRALVNSNREKTLPDRGLRSGDARRRYVAEKTDSPGRRKIIDL